MKDYTVYFIIKKFNHGYLTQKTVSAKNMKVAIQIVKDTVKTETGRHAFTCTCKAPIKNKNGLEYNGKTYSKYSELFNQLW